MEVILFLFQIHLLYHVLIRRANKLQFIAKPGSVVFGTRGTFSLCTAKTFQSYDTRFKIYSSPAHDLVSVMHVHKVAESEYYCHFIFMYI
jgi:hypothetical protein